MSETLLVNYKFIRYSTSILTDKKLVYRKFGRSVKKERRDENTLEYLIYNTRVYF